MLTLQIYLVTIVFSTLSAIGLAMAAQFGPGIVRRILVIYAWIFRGTPLLLQLFFVYFGLPSIGVTLAPFTAACLTFIVNYAAYLLEIFRAGLAAVPNGQYEAAYALNMSAAQTMRRIILPQAIRRVVPPYTNEAINLIKDSALVITIGMVDMMGVARQIFTRQLNITPFVIVGLVYLAASSLIVLISRRVETTLQAKGGIE